MGKHNGKSEKQHTNSKGKKSKSMIRTLLILVAVGCIAYIAYYYIGSYMESKEVQGLLNDTQIDANQIQEDENKEEPVVTERMLKVQKLQKDTNSEIVGWLEMKGTNINYPIMQGSDNDFYMNHSYKKTSNKQGSLFLHKDYDWNIPSNNMIIYGHNNSKDGSMFATLLKYEKESFYKKYPTFRFTTDKEDAEYDVIGAFRSKVYKKSDTNVFRYYKFINSTSEEEYNDFIKNVKKSAAYDTGKTAEYGDQLITLTTCAYHTTDGRFVVVGRKISK